jgi:hypothetical protein
MTMHEIICPRCKVAFKIDEAGYADILKQVHDQEFDEALRERLDFAEKEKIAAIEFAEAKVTSELEMKSAKKDTEIERLKDELKSTNLAKETAVNLVEAKAASALSDETSKKDVEIERLKSELERSEVVRKLAVNEAVVAVEKERDDIARDLESKETERKLFESILKESHSAELKSKDEQIAYYKDLKARQSTKMIGESLERHCDTEFNKIRAAAFPRAYFEKDNDARSGSRRCCRFS